MKNFTYSSQHPKILEAGEKAKQLKLDKFNSAKASKHIFALVQDFYDFIGHQESYTKEYFEEIKKQPFPALFHQVSEEFPREQQFRFVISSIRLMTRYAEFAIEIQNKWSIKDVDLFYVKVKYDDYFKIKKEVNPIFLDRIEYHNVPNNYLQHDARKDIWKFDFKNIDFSAKPR